MTQRKGPWSQPEIERFLEQTRAPAKIACNGSSGFPVLASLWFRPEGGRIWCATQKSSRVVAHLRRDPRCAFEVAQDTAPYRGVRGQGVAALHEERGEAVLRSLIERYVGDLDSEFARWLLARAENETAISIEPQTLLSWDFRERMRAA